MLCILGYQSHHSKRGPKHCGYRLANDVQFNSIQFHSVQSNSVQFNSIWFNSVQFNTTLFIPEGFLSQLDYGNIVYGFACPAALSKRDSLYHTALGYILKSAYRPHHCILYNLVGWSSLTTRRTDMILYIRLSWVIYFRTFVQNLFLLLTLTTLESMLGLPHCAICTDWIWKKKSKLL